MGCCVEGLLLGPFGWVAPASCASGKSFAWMLLLLSPLVEAAAGSTYRDISGPWHNTTLVTFLWPG